MAVSSSKEGEFFSLNRVRVPLVATGVVLAATALVLGILGRLRVFSVPLPAQIAAISAGSAILGLSLVWLILTSCRQKSQGAKPDLEAIPTRRDEGQVNKIYTAEEVETSLTHKPEFVNKRIDFGNYRQVYVSHLLCSGILFPGQTERTVALIGRIRTAIDLTLIDESNLWGLFEDRGSGNNVLKSAVAGASASITGQPDGRKIVKALFGLLERHPKRKQILDAGDHFPFGAHTIPEFLVRQGNEDLALRALELGASITNELLILALASAATTDHGVELALRVIEYYVKNGIKLPKDVHWRAKFCLLAVDPEHRSLDEATLQKGTPITKEHILYWDGIGFYAGLEPVSREHFSLFGPFSNQYRVDNDRCTADNRSEFLNKNPNELKKFQTLCQQFSLLKCIE